MPVSSPVAALMVSSFPLRVNWIVSPTAVPSNVSVLSRFLMSTLYLLPFLVTFSEVPSTPGHVPSSAVTFADGAEAGAFGSTEGLTEGEAAGVDGEPLTAGLELGAAAGLTGSVGWHAAKTPAVAANKTVKIDLLIVLFPFSGRIAVLSSRTTTPFGPANSSKP